MQKIDYILANGYDNRDCQELEVTTISEFEIAMLDINGVR